MLPKYKVCELIKEGNVQFLDWYVTNNEMALKDFNFDNSGLFYNYFSTMMEDYGFDLLVFAIDCNLLGYDKV